MSNKLKVLFLADCNSFHSSRFVKELKNQNCHVLTVSVEKGMMHSLQLRRIGPIKSLHYFLSIPQLRNIISRFQPDVVNAHYASGYGFIASLAIPKQKTFLVLNLWGSDILIVPSISYLHKLKTRYALKKAACVFGDSQYLIDAARNITRLKKTKVIPWGIERKYFSLHKKNYTFQRPLRIITPRPHEKVYNNLFIVKGLAPLISDGSIALTFPEFGSLVDSFKKQTKELVGNKIIYYPKLPRKDFLSFMAGYDIYLSASLSDSSPVSLLEAMALGLLPIAAEIDGVKEWLNDKSSFTYRQNDQDDLRKLISWIVTGSKNFEEMRQSNFTRVKKEAVFEDNITEQVKIMKSLVQKEQD